MSVMMIGRMLEERVLVTERGDAVIRSSFRHRARDHVTLGVYDLCEFRAV